MIVNHDSPHGETLGHFVVGFDLQAFRAPLTRFKSKNAIKGLTMLEISLTVAHTVMLN